MGFPGNSDSNESACNVGPRFNPESGRSSGEGDGNPFQYSCLENPMDRGTWQVTVHSITKSWTPLSERVCTLRQALEHTHVCVYMYNSTLPIYKL